jgi:hypothetical protein
MIDRMWLDCDPEFQDFCPPLDDDEKAKLLASLKKEGCREPILYVELDGKKLIVDGHHRFAICWEHGFLYETRKLDLKDRGAVCKWMLDNQTGRRNLSPAGKSLLIAKYYATYEVCSNVLHTPEVGETAKTIPHLKKKVAEELGISEKTVQDANAFAKAMQKLPAGLRSAALQGTISKRDAHTLSDAPHEVLEHLNKASGAEQKAGAKLAAKAVRDSRPKRPSGTPIVDCRPLEIIDTKLGEITRLMTKAFESCGGEKNQWAVDCEGAFRHCLNEIFDCLLDWKKKARERAAA